MRTFKRFLSLFVVLMMVISMVPATVFATETESQASPAGVCKVTSGETETYYESLEAAVAAANDGDTITVLQNISDETVVVKKNVTIKGAEGVTLENVIIEDAPLTPEEELAALSPTDDDIYVASNGTRCWFMAGDKLLANGDVSYAEVVTDSLSTIGKAVCSDVGQVKNDGNKTWYVNQFKKIATSGLSVGGLGGTIPAAELKVDGKYHVYKIEDSTFTEGKYYQQIGLFPSVGARWWSDYTSNETAVVDVYISMRIEGDISCPTDNLPAYYVDKMVFVKDKPADTIDTLKLDGLTFTGTSAVNVDIADLTVNNCTFNNTTSETPIQVKGDIAVEVTGGNLTMDNISVADGFTGALAVGKTTDGEGKLTGGTFNYDPTEDIAAGYLVKASDGRYTIVAPAAMIGETGYETLQAAMDAAQDGDEITVLQNISDETVTVKQNVTITGNATLNNVTIKDTLTPAEELEILDADRSGVYKSSNLTYWLTPESGLGTNAGLTYLSVVAESDGRKAIKADPSQAGSYELGLFKKYPTNGLTMSWSKAGTIGTIPADVLKANADTGYHIYKFEDFTLTANVDLVQTGLFPSYGVQIYNQHSVTQDTVVDVYISMKIEGELDFSNASSYPIFYVDKIVVAYNKTVDTADTLTIDGLTFTGNSAVDVKTADLTVNGCNFNTTTAPIQAAGSVDVEVTGGNLTAEDITLVDGFTGSLAVGKTTDEYGSLTGGTFNKMPEAEIADGYILKESDDRYTVVKAVARIDDKQYATLQEAMEAAVDNDTITVLADVSNETVTVKQNVTITGDAELHNVTIKDVSYEEELAALADADIFEGCQFTNSNTLPFYHDASASSVYTEGSDPAGKKVGIANAGGDSVTADQLTAFKATTADGVSVGYANNSLGKIPAAEIVANDEQYHIYKLEDATFAKGVERKYFAMFEDNGVRVYHPITPSKDAVVDVYISMRVDGDITCNSEDLPVYYIDKVVIAYDRENTLTIDGLSFTGASTVDLGTTKKLTVNGCTFNTNATAPIQVAGSVDVEVTGGNLTIDKISVATGFTGNIAVGATYDENDLLTDGSFNKKPAEEQIAENYAAIASGNYFTVIPHASHTEVEIPAVDATCTETGLNPGVKCSVCDKVLVEQTVVPALGHTYTYEQKDETVHTVGCEICDYTAEEAHKAADAVQENVVEATCTVAGSYDLVVSCSVCDEELSRKTVVGETLPHTDADDDDHKCDVCGEEDVSDHTMEAVSQKDASCTESGLKAYSKCTECQDHFLDAEDKLIGGKSDFDAWAASTGAGYIPAQDHAYSEEITLAPTCTEKGEKTFTCENCPDSYTESIEATGHSPAAAVREEGKAADYNNAGYYYMVVKCSVCTEELSRETVDIPMLSGAVAEINGYKYGTLQAAFDAAKDGDTVKLLTDVELDSYLNITTAGAITLDMNGMAITREGTGVYVSNAETVLTITGEGAITATQAVWAAAGQVILVNGTYHGGVDAIYVSGTGNIVIEGGTYSADESTHTQNKYCILNQRDADRATTSITVKGGNFVGFNPYDNASEGAGTNFCAADKHAADNGEGVYVVHALEVEELAAVAPDCVNTGLTAGSKCETCDEILVAQEVVPATGHDFSGEKGACVNEGCDATACGQNGHTDGNTIVEKMDAADCENAGSYDEATYCTICGIETSRKTITVGALGHNWGEGVYTEPTVTANGYYTYTCSNNCGSSYTEEVEGTKLTVDTQIPDEGIQVEGGEELNDDDKKNIEKILTESEQVKEALNLPDNTYLKITLSSAKVEGEKVTKLTYHVKPITNGEENSNPGQKITFYLPVPYQTEKGVAAVFHEEILLGADYQIKEKNGEFYVVVESDTFSEYTVDLNYTSERTMSYAEFNQALRDANGVFDGENLVTVVLKDTERSYQNNKTAQFFIGGTNINITDPLETVQISNVIFKFEDDDTTNTYTSGELQVFAKYITFTGCTFIGTAVSPWGVSNSENAETATFTACKWQDLSGRYGVHQNRASTLKVTGCTFENCERGIHTNSSTPTAITITGNTFTGIGEGYGVLCLAESGDLSKATLNISGNTAEGQVMLRQLNANVTSEQLSEILDTTKNTYGTAYVSGTEPKTYVAEVNGTQYETLKEALTAVQEGQTIQLLPDVTIDLGGVGLQLPLVMTNVTIKGADGHTSVIKNGNLIQNGSNFNLSGVTFDGVVFEDAYIVLTPWDGNSFITDLTVNNCIFRDLDNADTMAPLHITQAGVKNVTFTNNEVKNLTGGNKSGMFVFASGNITISGNTFDNVAFRSTILQVHNNDGVADNIVYQNNTISNSPVGRIQILGAGTGAPTGTDTVDVKLNENVITGVTNTYQFCVYSFNTEKTTTDLSKNYYDIDIVANPDKIYVEKDATGIADLVEMGIYPYYADEAKTQQVTAPVAVIGTQGYETFEAALSAAEAGDTIELLADVEIANNNAYAVVIKKSITIDGKGHSISQAEGYTNQWALLYFQDAEEVTIKNVVFDGVTGGAAIWAINTDVLVDGCVFQNGKHSQIQGLIRMTSGDATIKNTKFLNNECNMIVSFNFDLEASAPSVDALKIQDCEFTGNNCADTALIYFVKGVSSEISGSTFTGNTVDTASHGAIAYYSEGANGTVTDNVFSGNTIKAASARAGILVLEAGTAVSGNAFIGNNVSSTATGATYVATVVNKADADTEGVDISGNYWGDGEEPNENDYVSAKGAPTKLTDYYTTVAEDGTLGGLTEIKTYVAEIVGGAKYESLEAAFAAAGESDTIVLLSDATPVLTSQRAITKAAVIDLNGNTLTLTEDDLYFGTTTFKNGTIVVDPSVKPSTAVFWMFANQTLTFDDVKLVATGVTGTYLIGLDGNNSDLNIINGSEIVIENETALDLDIICVNASTGNDILVQDSKVSVTNLDGRVFFRGNYTISGTSDIDLSGITKAGFRIEAGQTLTIADTATVDIVGEPRDGGIHLTDTTAVYTKADTATVNATVNKPIVYVAEVNGIKYEILEDALAAASAGDEIILLSDIDGNVNVPANVVLNGNGKQIKGTLYLLGDVTFKGHVKATAFDFEKVGTVINIPVGATLELNGTGRMVIGHGCTFNITGTITDAKAANVADLTPSLIAPGASFTGAGVNFNVTNAYVKFTAYCSSKNSNASGTHNINVTNSIWEQTGSLVFSEPTNGKDPTFNFHVKDSVLNSTSHLVFAVTKGEIVFDNSNVNVGTSRQIENRSTMTIKNGSVVNGAVATSSNAKNPGTIIVDNATYAVTGEFSGSDLGTGTLVLKNGANVSVGSITKANIQIDATGMNVGDTIDLTANLSKFAGTIEVVNNDGLKAEIDENGKIVLVERNLPGSGTETDPYTISSVEELFLFAQKVNGGKSYKGEYVKLMTDINLEGQNWTPIGTTETPFNGNFDGGDKTISNVVVSGTKNVGFFGYANGCTIKNLTIENITVAGTDCVGGIAGQVYSTSTIDNCHVTGTVRIEGQTNVGGIVGKYYVKVSNSSVIGDGVDTSWVKGTYYAADLEGDNIGGIMGHGGESNNFVGNTVKNITISGTRKVGGIVGTTNRGTNVNGCTVENVTILTTATEDYAKDNLTSMDLGGLIGHYYGTATGGTLANSDIKDVTFVTNGIADAGAIVGGDRTNPNAAPIGVTATNITATGITGATQDYLFVAKVNGQAYLSLAEAIEAANGGTVEILCDITESIAAIENVTLTTNVAGGVTITNTYEDDYVDFNNVTVDSGVTLNVPYVLASGDVDNVIEGTLNVSNVYYNRYNATTIIRNGGKATSGGMTIVRYNSDATAGIYIYGDGDDSTVELSCGDTLGVYSGIFYVEDAVVEAQKIWIDHEQEPDNYVAINANFVDAKLNLSQQLRLYKDANLNLTGTAVTVGEQLQIRTDATPVVNMDATSTIKAPSILNQPGTKLNAALDAEGYVSFFVPVASVDGKNYGSLQEAVNAAAEDDVITLLDNVTGAGVVIDKDLTIDFGGFTYTVNKTVGSAGTETLGFQILKGNDVTLKNGALVASETVVEGSKAVKMLIQNYANLTLEDMDLTGASTTTYVLSNNSGEIAVTGETNITATEGNVAFDVYDYSSAGYEVPSMTINTTGTITGKIEVSETADLAISGGIYTVELDETWCAEGYIPTANDDGTYGVKVGKFVAQIEGGAKYESLAKAIEAAQANDTVKLIDDLTLTEKITISKSMTLDLNGKTITTSGIVSSRVFVLADGCTEFTLNGNGGAIKSADAQAYGIIDVNTTANVTVNGGSYDFDTNNGGLFKFRNFVSTITLNDVYVETNAQVSGPNSSGNVLDVNGGTFKAVNGYNVRNVFSFYVENAKATFDDVTIENGYIGGIENWGGEVTVTNCNISVVGTNSSPFLSTAVAVSGCGDVTINGGNYSTKPAAASDANGQGNTHGSWTIIVMSSGGNMTINDGIFSNGVFEGTASNPRGVISIGADADYGDNVATNLVINGGTFNSIGNLVDCETIWGSETDPANTYMPTMDVVITDGDFTGVAGKAIGGCDPISTGNPVGVEISGGTYGENHAIDASYLALGYIVSANNDQTYSVIDDPTTLYISSLEELKAFRDDVNAGNTYKGITVYLAADIDLANEAWTPIGSDKNHAFKGVFDGQNHTISNLYINNGDLAYAGLFGYAEGAKINNVNIKNVNIYAYSHVGSVVGSLYTGSATNCHVSGTINLVSQYAYAGGITGYGYNNIYDCSVIAEGTGIIKVEEKTGAGGIVGWHTEGNLGIYNCIAKNLEITAWTNLGGITGFVHYQNTIDGCTVENVTLTKTRVDGQAGIGIAAGGWSNKPDNNYTITITDNTFNNVTMNGTAINSHNALYGSNYSYYDVEINLNDGSETGNANTYGTITNNVKVEVNKEADLQKALAYCREGEVIYFGSTFEVSSALVATNNVTLDLNGNSVTFADGGAIVLDEIGATLTAPEGLNVTTNVADYKVVYADGAYKLVEKVYVAQVGEEKFESLAEAVEAAEPGATIELLTDITESVTVNKAVTINGNGKTVGSLTVQADVTLAGVLNAASVMVYSGKLTVAEGAEVDCTGTLAVYDGGKITVEQNSEISASSIYFNGGNIDIYGTMTATPGNDGGFIVNGEGDTVNVFEGGALNVSYVDIYKTTGDTTVNVYGDATVGFKMSDGSAKFTWNIMENGSLNVAKHGIVMNSADSQINIAGEATTTAVTGNGTITLTDVNATFTAPADLDVTTNVADYKVAYADGAYTLIEKDYVAQIGDVKFETVEAAVEYAQAEGLTDVTITLIGTVTKDQALALDDSLYLYTEKVFDRLTLTQEDASQPYYIAGIYTGSRTNGGQFVFDGVNVVVLDQYILEGNVILTNNSVVKSVAEANCFLYYAEVTIEPGSKLYGVIEDFRGGDLIVDGGRTDGAYNTDPDVRDSIMTIRWSGDKLVLKNGAYVKINAVNEVGRLNVESGAAVEMSASRLDAWQYVDLKAGAALSMDLFSYIETAKFNGAGKITVDVSGFDGNAVQIIKADMSAFTGAIELVGSDGTATYEVTSTGLVIKKAVATVNGVGYKSLAEAVEAAEAGATVELLANAVGDGIVIDKDLTIDFGGFTYTVNKTVGSTGTETLGFQILKGNDVTLKNGALVASETVVEGSKAVKMLIQNYANLTLEDMDLTGASTTTYVLSNNSGKIAATGETNITATEGNVAFDVYDYSSAGYEVPSMTINTTGTITGKIEVSETADLAISGGIYTVELDDTWCAEGFIPTENADGTFGVIERPIAHIPGHGTLMNTNGTYIHFNIYSAYAEESIVLKLYAGDVLIATCEMVNPAYLRYLGGNGTLTANFEITRQSSTWETVWVGQNPDAAVVPTRVELYIDGEYYDDAGMGFTAEEWAATEGVKAYAAEVNGTKYETLQQAVNAAAEGDTIELWADCSNEMVFVKKQITVKKNGFGADLYAGRDSNNKSLVVTENETAYVVMLASALSENKGQSLAYIDVNNDGVRTDEELMTLQDALDAAAAYQIVRMTADLTVGTVMLPADVTLDLQTYTLTADRVIGLNGSKLMGATVASDGTGSGKLVVAKKNLLLTGEAPTNAAGMSILPVWIENEGYIFSLFDPINAVMTPELTITEDAIRAVFRHNASAYVNDLLELNGATPYGLSVKITLTWEIWKDGAFDAMASQTFDYSDTLIQTVADNRHDYTFNLSNYENMDIDLATLKIAVTVESDCGAVGTGYELDALLQN